MTRVSTSSAYAAGFSVGQMLRIKWPQVFGQRLSLLVMFLMFQVLELPMDFQLTPNFEDLIFAWWASGFGEKLVHFLVTNNCPDFDSLPPRQKKRIWRNASNWNLTYPQVHFVSYNREIDDLASDQPPHPLAIVDKEGNRIFKTIARRARCVEAFGTFINFARDIVYINGFVGDLPAHYDLPQIQARPGETLNFRYFFAELFVTTLQEYPAAKYIKHLAMTWDLFVHLPMYAEDGPRSWATIRQRIMSVLPNWRGYIIIFDNRSPAIISSNDGDIRDRYSIQFMDTQRMGSDKQMLTPSMIRHLVAMGTGRKPLVSRLKGDSWPSLDYGPAVAPVVVNSDWYQHVPAETGFVMKEANVPDIEDVPELLM